MGISVGDPSPPRFRVLVFIRYIMRTKPDLRVPPDFGFLPAADPSHAVTTLPIPRVGGVLKTLQARLCKTIGSMCGDGSSFRPGRLFPHFCLVARRRAFGPNPEQFVRSGKCCQNGSVVRSRVASGPVSGARRGDPAAPSLYRNLFRWRVHCDGKGTGIIQRMSPAH